MTGRRVLMSLALAAALSACAERASPLRGLCVASDECEPDLVCRDGFCVPYDCPTDTFWDREARVCAACPAGSRSDDRRATSCTPVACPADTRWDAVSRSCPACPKDTVSDGGGATDCRAIDCPVDTLWEDKARVCLPCPRGASSEGGLARTCAPWGCPPDTRWDVSVRRCVDCPETERSDGGDVDACVPAACAPGERWDPLLRACVACGPAETSPGGSVLVCIGVDCPTDQRWDRALLACVDCDAGTLSGGGPVLACAAPDCPPDSRWDVPTRSCVPCLGGTTSAGGAVFVCEPLACDVDERVDAGADACVPCPPGTLSDGGAVSECRAIDCARDHVWSEEARTCLPCPTGLHSAGGDATVCRTACPGEAFGSGQPLAGSIVLPGTTPPTDGTGAAARFGGLASFRRDPTDGSLLVLDGALRRVTPAGVVTTVVSAADLCPGGFTRIAYSNLAVAPDGTAFWFCGARSVRRRSTDGTLTALNLPASAPINPQSLVAGFDGRLYLAAGWRSCAYGDPAYPACIETRLWRVESDGELTPVWRNAGLADAVTVVSDAGVTAEGVAYLADPNGVRILRADTATGNAAPVVFPQGARGAMGQHLTLDAAGRLYAEGQSVSPAGGLVGTFDDRTLEWGIALLGPDDDVVQAECERPGGAIACRLVRYPRICP